MPSTAPRVRDGCLERPRRLGPATRPCAAKSCRTHAGRQGPQGESRARNCVPDRRPVLSLIRTSIVPEYDFPEHDFPEQDLPEHDLLDHELSGNDVPGHGLPEHDLPEHDLPQPGPKPVKTARLHVAMSGAAVALAAAVAGTLGAGSVVAASQPAAISRPVPIVGQAHPSGTPFTVAPAF